MNSCSFGRVIRSLALGNIDECGADGGGNNEVFLSLLLGYLSSGLGRLHDTVSIDGVIGLPGLFCVLKVWDVGADTGVGNHDVDMAKVAYDLIDGRGNGGA